MKKCSRCGAEIWEGQAACPDCGKPLRPSRVIRCRYCGTAGSRSLVICPNCGERLQADWLRPIALVILAIAAVLIVVLVVRGLQEAWQSFRPAEILSDIRALRTRAQDIALSIPTLTPTLTPSVTPTPTNTPTVTPLPSLTPTPTPTPSPTETPTPTLTSTATPAPTGTPTRTPAATRGPTATRTPTPSPVPTAPAPVLLEPADGSPFGQKDIFRLAWQVAEPLHADECYLLTVRYTRQGAGEALQVCVQSSFWFVDKGLYGLADQETDRSYYWSVRLVRKSTDADGQESYTPLSPPSAEWRFNWH